MSDLYRFVSMGFTHQVKQLLDEGHDPNVPVQVKVGRKIEIQLPIEPACSQSDSEIFIALIKAGAVILPDPQRRNRMLERAAMVGNIPLLNILHSRGLTAELKNAKQGGNAPLVGAITQGKKEAAVWLLDHGADPNGKMKAGKYKVTPLDSVLSSGKMYLHDKKVLVQLLVDRGATPAFQDIPWKYELDHRGQLLAHIRKEQLMTIAHASRPNDLASPEEAQARRGRGRFM
ncbi:ankyrin repeat domain-containing protein [Stenotrophomonas maltophilia]|uniref:ankyrin repeat domain-containing protein n=1 Tax=Stenotrophomonas maltophilia TaxID=40324 RepID=UPI0011B649AC|nr:ankyrin repeat domain-containing protein [Stenotrophomonas maltophilia]